MSDNSLINFGDLSKPATVLIEKISDALGSAFKPYQIRRVAKAESEAAIIRAHTEIEIQDIRLRAGRRFLEEETRKQINIETITKKALPLLSHNAKSEDVENDWIVNFFDKCRLISDEEMQQLWAAVLAGEANEPGSFSKRTVNALSSLDKRDAEMFEELCAFVWTLEDAFPLIYSDQEEVYQKHGINFGSLSHLQSIGLIVFNPVTSYQRLKLPQQLNCSYFNQNVDLKLPKQADNTLKIGTVLLSQIGAELAKICHAEPDQDFFEYVCATWQKMGLIIEHSAVRPE